MPAMCMGCDGRCCRIIADITSFDIVRIASATKKHPSEFAMAVKAKDDDSFAFRAMGTRMKFILRHKGDEYGTPCIFLDEKTFKCSVHWYKPATCTAYPFSFSKTWVALSPTNLCPEKNREIADKDPMPLETLHDCKAEWDRYMEFLLDWNTRARGNEAPDEFFVFAKREMELESSAFGRIYRKMRRRISSFFRR